MLHADRPTALRQDLGAIDAGIAVSTEDLDAAFGLVHARYVERGYATPAPEGRRLTPYHALPSTTVFVVRASGGVVATVSLIEDAELGLPCDDLYPDTLRGLRAAGRRLGEVAALAVAPTSARDGLGHVERLIQVVGVFGACIARLDDLCITVHPRHARFYEGQLDFVRFGAVTRYAAVNGAPAIGLRLRLRERLVQPTAAMSRLAARLFSPAAVRRMRRQLGRRASGGTTPSMQLFHHAARDSAHTGSASCASLHAQ